MLLRRATLQDGSTSDVRLDGALIAAVAPAGGLQAMPHEEVWDLAGYLLLPAPVEPHAHLDKARTAHRVPNPSGDLLNAIEAWHAYRPRLQREEILGRARHTALQYLGHGATAIRTHVDVGTGIGLRAVEALAALRGELVGVLQIQIVALATPLGGPDGAENRVLLKEALHAGADVVGGAPHVDPDPLQCLEFCLAVAAEAGRGVDLHMDETLDPAHLGLADLARLVAEGFPHAAAASHCVSLGVRPAADQVRVAEAVAAAGVAVVTLPQTNLYLQGRGLAVSTPRGLTALRPLLAAGVTVAAGGDNLQDPFNPLGRADPMETAALLVAAGHLTLAEAYAAVSGKARAVMGLAAVEVAPGYPADLLAIEAASLGDAIATASEDRLVFAGGRLVARTRVERDLGAQTAERNNAKGREQSVKPGVRDSR